MNKFYTNKVKTTRQGLPVSVKDPYKGLRTMMQGKDIENKLKIRIPAAREIDIMIKRMKPTTSSGSDSINMKMIKDYYPALREPLHNLIRTTIRTGTFPESLKTSRVIPLFKGGKHTGQSISCAP